MLLVTIKLGGRGRMITIPGKTGMIAVSRMCKIMNILNVTLSS